MGEGSEERTLAIASSARGCDGLPDKRWVGVIGIRGRCCKRSPVLSSTDVDFTTSRCRPIRS